MYLSIYLTLALLASIGASTNIGAASNSHLSSPNSIPHDHPLLERAAASDGMNTAPLVARMPPRRPQRLLRLPLTRTPEAARYTTEIRFNGQPMRMMVDTGSHIMWGCSDQMVPEVRERHNYIQDGAALTNPGSVLDVPYDAGRVRGTWGDLTLEFGGITTPLMPVGLAEEIPADMEGDSFDGLFPLGPPEPGLPDVLDNLYRHRFIDHRVFSLDLRGRHSGSRLDMGGADPSRYRDRLTWTPAEFDTYSWWFTPTGIAIGRRGRMRSHPGLRGVLDTGAAAIQLPADIAAEYYANIDHQVVPSDPPTRAVYTFACDAQLSDLHVEIENNIRVTIPRRHMNLGLYENTDQCYGALMGIASGEKTVWGNVLMEHAFFVFDRASLPPRIGVAQKR